MIPDKDAFSIQHHDSVLHGGTVHNGVNLVVNGDAETNDFTGWATHTNWSVVSAATSVPPARGAYAFRAGSGAGAVTSTLLSNRMAISGNTFYRLVLEFGAGGAKPTNTLMFRVKYWNAPVGGASQGIGAWTTVIPGPDPLNMHGYNGRVPMTPNTATHVEIEIVNNSNAGLGATAGTVIDNVFYALDQVANEKPPIIETLKWAGERALKSFAALKYASNFSTGFTSCTFKLHDDPEALWYWVTQALGHHIEVYYENQQVFCGLVWDMDGYIAGFGGVHLSYDSIWNIVRVRTAYEASAHDTESQKRYGQIKHVEMEQRGGPLAVQARANYLLNLHKQPTYGDSSSNELNVLTVTVMGYWSTLAFMPVGEGFRSDTAQDTAAVVATNGQGIGAGPPFSILSLYYKVNPFLSTDYSRCAATGMLVKPGDYDDVPEGTPSTIIARLMSYGSGEKRQLVSGVWEDRKFVIRKRSIVHDYINTGTPTKPEWRDAGGYLIPTPLLQAGRLVRGARPVPTWVSYSADEFMDPACRFWIQTEYDMESNRLTVQTPQSTDLDLLFKKITYASVVLPGGPGSRYPTGGWD